MKANLKTLEDIESDDKYMRINQLLINELTRTMQKYNAEKEGEVAYKHDYDDIRERFREFEKCVNWVNLIETDDLRSTVQTWIKELDKPIKYFGIPLIIAEMKKLDDETFIEMYRKHMQIAMQNVLRAFFNLEGE